MQSSTVKTLGFYCGKKEWVDIEDHGQSLPHAPWTGAHSSQESKNKALTQPCW